MASAVFVIHKKTDLISAPASCVHLIVIIFFVYFKILGISDPLLPIENVFKKIFLGGIFDTLQETFYGKPEESEESSKQGNNYLNDIFAYPGASDPGGQLPTQYLRESPLRGKICANKIFFVP